MERKRFLIFNLGLLVTGSFTLAAFTYTDTVDVHKGKMAVLAEELHTFEVTEKVEVKPIVQPKQQEVEVPQQPQQPQNLGSQTGLSTVITAVQSGTTGPKIPDGGGNFGGSLPSGGVKIITTEEIVIPKIDAKYVGGHNAMVEKIMSVQEYPEIDRELGNQGTVYVSFVVEKDGSISNIKTAKGISKTLDREAERIVRSFPKWIPGEDEYGVVRTRVSMPIKFILRD